MSNFQKLNDLPIYDLYSELNNLIEKNMITWSKENQICLTTVSNEPDNYLLGCGSLIYNWDQKNTIIDQYGNESFKVEEHKKKYKEEDFVIFCSQFKNTLFEKVYTELSIRYKLGRIRIMKNKPKTCLTWHTDNTPRIHYSMKTQDGCFMVIDNEVNHLTQNTWWWTNTILPHTAFNGSKEDRIHLVAVILEEK